MIQTSSPLEKLDIQDDAQARCFGRFLLIELRSDWIVDGTTYRMGSLLSFDFREFISGDRSSVQVCYHLHHNAFITRKLLMHTILVGFVCTRC